MTSDYAEGKCEESILELWNSHEMRCAECPSANVHATARALATVAAAIVAAAFEVALPAKTGVYGEISLSGDVRPVGRSEARLKEAAKLGFERAIAPEAARSDAGHVTIEGVATALELVQTLKALAGE